MTDEYYFSSEYTSTGRMYSERPELIGCDIYGNDTIYIRGDIVICTGQCFNFYEVEYTVLNSIYPIDISDWEYIKKYIGTRNSFDNVMMNKYSLERYKSDIMGMMRLNNEFRRYMIDNYRAELRECI